MSNKKALTRRELVNEISEVTGLKDVVVRSVLDSFADIFVREAVMTGKFNFSNCFTVSTSTRKARVQYNVNKDKYEKFPETEILSIKLSRKIHYYNRWKQRHEFNNEHGLTVEDWRNRESEEIPE